MTEFSELIRREEHVLRRLVAISAQQLELVRGGDVTLLIRFLGQKERVLNEFLRLTEQLAPHRGIPPEQRKWSSESERVATGEAINRCEAMLAEILRNDLRSTEETAEQKNELEALIRRTQQSSQAQTAYTKTDARTSTTRRFQAES